MKRLFRLLLSLYRPHTLRLDNKSRVSMLRYQERVSRNTRESWELPVASTAHLLRSLD